MKPIFLATHPRAASTAFERSFMSRDDVVAVHEPFGEPYHFGPERLAGRYTAEEVAQSKHRDLTYARIYSQLVSLGDAIFVKDMAQCLMPYSSPARLAPSFGNQLHTNPTVLPDEALNHFNYIFLIRPPHLSVPSYYTCCIPPRSEVTGFEGFISDEAGYRELRVLFDYLQSQGHTPLVVDAEDLGRDPETVMREVCKRGDIPFHPSMLSWSDHDADVEAKFAKWPGFHADAMHSTGFRITNPPEFQVNWAEWEKTWRQKFSEDDVGIIKSAVAKHLPDYLYLAQFKLAL